MQQGADILKEELNEIDHKKVEFITVDEMAKLLSIARGTAYELIKEKGFPCFRIRKRVIIPKESFNEWVKEQAIKQANIFTG